MAPLSVAEPHAVRHGRPVVGILLVLGVALALAGILVALVFAMRAQPAPRAHPGHHAAVTTPTPAP